MGKHDFADVEVKFKEMGFNRVFAPSHDLEDVCALITNDIHQHNGLEQRCPGRGYLMQTVSVDIGSTWTKAALFAHEGEELTLINHVLTPTTTHHLADGFFASLNQVLNVADARPLLKSGEVQLKYSSSAKGGLAVAAMGLVPSITLESAKVTAHSAGAKSRNIIRTNLTAMTFRSWNHHHQTSCCLPVARMAVKKATVWLMRVRWPSQSLTAPLSTPVTATFRTMCKLSRDIKI